jgi:hypothetical protein
MILALRHVISTEAKGRLEKSRRDPQARIGLGQTHSTSLRFAQGDKRGQNMHTYGWRPQSLS